MSAEDAFIFLFLPWYSVVAIIRNGNVVCLVVAELNYNSLNEIFRRRTHCAIDSMIVTAASRLVFYGWPIIALLVNGFAVFAR